MVRSEKPMYPIRSRIQQDPLAIVVVPFPGSMVVEEYTKANSLIATTLQTSYKK